MKFTKLFILLLTAMTFSLASCGGDDDDNGCTKCKLSIPILDDCEIDVCADGATSTEAGGANCLGGETALTGLSTQAEKVAALEAIGFSCN